MERFDSLLILKALGLLKEDSGSAFRRPRYDTQALRIYSSIYM
jgi:hypothetical protein